MPRLLTVTFLSILAVLVLGSGYWYVKTYFLTTNKNQNLRVQQNGPICATTEVLPAIVDGISMEGILDPGSHVTYLSGAYSCGMSVKR